LTETINTIKITSTMDLEKEKLDFQSTLDSMENSGLIGRTPEGNIFITRKGQKLNNNLKF
jgi:hypothetical protein